MRRATIHNLFGRYGRLSIALGALLLCAATATCCAQSVDSKQSNKPDKVSSGPAAATDKQQTPRKPIRIIQPGQKSSSTIRVNPIQVKPKSQKNFLGLRVGTISPALKSQIPALDKLNYGMIVTAVIRKSPAERDGVKKHDIILKVDTSELRSNAQLKKTIETKAAGATVAFTILREGRTSIVRVKLGQTTNTSTKTIRPINLNEGPGAALQRSKNGALPRFYTSVSLTPKADDIFDLEIRTRQGVAPESVSSLSGSLVELRKAIAKEDRLVQSNVVFSLNFFKEPDNRSRMRFKVSPHFVQGWKFVRVTMVRRLEDGTPTLYSLDKRVADNGPPPLADVMQNESFKAQINELSPPLQKSISNTIKRYNSLTSGKPGSYVRPAPRQPQRSLK